MENASEALKIAGGVLIGVLVLSLLVVFYMNMKEWNKNEEMITYQEQSAKFNKEYDVYIRNIYGSELLSLVNKVDNYNKLESEEGYFRMEVVVTFKNNIGGFTKNKEYSTNTIINIMNSLKNNVETYGNKTYEGKKVSQLAIMRTNELEQFFIDKKINSSKKSQIEEDIKKYTTYKADEVTIKSKNFKYISSTYDNTTGRMTQIKYQEL